MTLSEHIAELRNRLLKSVVAIVVGTVVGWIYREPLLEILKRPFETSVAALLRSKGIQPQLTMTGVADPFTFNLKIAMVFGLVLSSPVWLYQMWAFVAPGLHRNEKKWAMTFAAVAAPLFFAGILLGYFTLPKGIEILIGFTPKGVQNLITLPSYLDFTLTTLLVFGIAFLIPVLVMLLNLAGVLPGRALGKARPYVIVAVFVFAAAATPSTDPFTMTFLAVPMCALFLAAEVLARMSDKRRAARRNDS